MSPPNQKREWLLRVEACIVGSLPESWRGLPEDKKGSFLRKTSAKRGNDQALWTYEVDEEKSVLGPAGAFRSRSIAAEGPEEGPGSARNDRDAVRETQSY